MARPTSRVSRVVMTGPLAPYRAGYARALRARGYTPRSAVNELRQVARLSRWLDGGGLTVGEPDADAGRGVPGLPTRHGAVPFAVVASGAAVPAGGAARTLGSSPPRSRRRRARRARCCWVASSAICSPSAVWRPARSGGMSRTRAGSWTGLASVGLADVTAG